MFVPRLHRRLLLEHEHLGRRRVGVFGVEAEFPIVAIGHPVVANLVIVEARQKGVHRARSEEHTSELQSLMRISYAVFCLKKKNKDTQKHLKTSLKKQ